MEESKNICDELYCTYEIIMTISSVFRYLCSAGTYYSNIYQRQLIFFISYVAGRAAPNLIT